MPGEENGHFDWRADERIRKDIQEPGDRTLRDLNLRLHEDIQSLVEDIRKLIDRIPPESLR